MLFRVAGKLTDGRPFSSRTDSDSALGAIAQFQRGLVEAKVENSAVAEISAKSMKGSAIYIGEPKAPKAPATAKPTAPASGNKK